MTTVEPTFRHEVHGSRRGVAKAIAARNRLEHPSSHSHPVRRRPSITRWPSGEGPATAERRGPRLEPVEGDAPGPVPVVRRENEQARRDGRDRLLRLFMWTAAALLTAGFWGALAAVALRLIS